MTFRKTVIYGGWICLLSLALPIQALALENISLQLKWKHGFQFAGFYMALEKGYYDARGLHVTLIEGGPDKNLIDEVLKSEGHYGVSDSGVILSRAKGQPVQILAAIFQHSPLVLATIKDSGIRTFSDLKGKRVMMQSGNMDAPLLAAMKEAGVSEGNFTRQKTSFNLQDLVDGKTDAFSVYLTDQPNQLQTMGIPHRLLRPSDYGIDFYGDILIASDMEVHLHPERTRAFIRASMLGWEYALEHIDETIDLIMARYNSQNLSRDQLTFEAYKTSEIVLKNVVTPGYMTLERWQKIAATYAKLGLLQNNFPVAPMLYAPEPGISDILARYRWQLLFIGLLSLLLIFGLQSFLLRRMVRSRTHDLQKSEIRFRTLVDNIPGAIFRCWPDAGYSMEFISDDIVAISGYPASDFIANAVQSYRSIIHPSDKTVVQDAIRFATEHSTSYTIEYRIRRADRSERWIMETAQVNSANDGVWIDGCILDITDRKRAENLRESITSILEMVAVERNLNHILDGIVAIYEQHYPGIRASILLLRDGRLYKGAAPSLPDEYNATIEGIEIGPLVGSCGTAAYSKERVIVSDIGHDPRWAAYADLVLPLGLRACWSEPIFSASGEVLGTFAMYADHPRSPSEDEIDDILHAAKITALAIERDQRFQRLKKLSRAVEQSSEVITIADRNGIIEYTNPAFTAITGYSREEAIGKTLRLLRDETQNNIVEQLREAMLKGEPWHGKITEQRKDGSTYPAMLTVSPMRSDEGEITHYIAVHEDMSQLQHMEEQFYQSQKMEAIGTLVGGIAHDFNNMLAGMTGNLYLARKEAEGQDRLNEKLARIEMLTMRAADMIKQLLTFASKDIVRKCPLSLSPFLKETLKLHRVSIPESIDLHVDIRDDPMVSADITQMQQVLLNLITNARDAVLGADQPAIRITLDKFSADKTFLARHPGSRQCDYARLSVQDNGSGIPPVILQHIFEPFFTTKEVGKGTGLGLSMVFGTIKSHDGFIDVESAEGKGSTFRICLPLLAATASQQENDADAEVEAGKGETILLVDDEQDLLDATAQVLVSLGYEVLQAGNGREALTLFLENSDRIRLILSDVVMPKMGGLELAEHVRAISPGIAIILATGYDRKHAMGEMPALENCCTLNKPFRIETLAQTVHRMLNAA